MSSHNYLARVECPKCRLMTVPQIDDSCDWSTCAHCGAALPSEMIPLTDQDLNDLEQLQTVGPLPARAAYEIRRMRVVLKALSVTPDAWMRPESIRQRAGEVVGR